jgi:tRNA nucleotidyltransferase (CCA-adding enzyme)
MDLIVSHSAADLDALASMVAARRLYPGARLCFTGAPSRDVRGLLRLFAGEFDVIDPQSALREQVGLLVIVETQHRSRLGRLGALLDRPGIAVHLFDHHPRVEGGIAPDHELIEPAGATTTLLVRRLRERGLVPTPAEATAMALGIYSDTGALTFRSTTPEDAQALAWLLGNGADLEIIRRFLHRAPTADERRLLERLLAATRRIEVNGYDIAIASATVPSSYVEELSQVVQRLAAVVGAAAVFAVIRIKGAVLVVARSASPDLDANEIMGPLGGGGHPYAASATLRGESLAGARRRLRRALEALVPAQPTVEALMRTPVVTLPPEASLDEADLRLRRGGQVVFVARSDRLLGAIDRAQVAGALAHGLGHAPMRGYLSAPPPRVSAHSTRAQAERLLERSSSPVLPVTSAGKLVGTVGARDLMRPVATPSPPGRELRDPGAWLRRQLPGELWRAAQAAGQLGDQRGERVFLVGGCVRDLLLGRATLDLDLMVEGDAIALARALARRLGARRKSEARFGTATVTVARGRAVDLAHSRSERYPEHDLRRRDFSVNAIALQINERTFGQLLDPTGGRGDLERGRIRALHEASFVDDPTRILRAARLAGRLGFAIERHTRALARRAAARGALATVSRDRVRAEMLLLLGEERAGAGLEVLDALGALPAQDPPFPYDQRAAARLARAGRAITWFSRRVGDPGDARLIRLLAVLEPLDDEAARRFLSGWRASERWLAMVDHRGRLREAVRSVLNRPEAVAPSELASALEPMPVEILVYSLGVAPPRVRRRIQAYLTEVRPRPRLLDGHLLKSLGGKPGPAFGEILAAVRAAQLDGEVRGRRQAEALARRLLRRRKRRPDR